MNGVKGGETMDDMMTNGVPLEAIATGRDMGAVLTEYRRIWEGAKKVALEDGKTYDEAFADAMMCAAYRIYLLGVEDGMKAVQV